MRLPQTRRPGTGRLEIQMTPMIDVIFLLMIFFVCTASFQPGEETLPTNLALPGSQLAQKEIESDVLELEEIVVRIGQDGGNLQWRVNDRRCEQLVEVRNILESLARIDRRLPVVLSVAPQVSLGHVIDLYDLCRMLGFQRVQFAASVRP